VGIDITDLHGSALGLLLLAGVILGFALLAERWAQVAGQSFFLPCLLAGTGAFTILFGGIQLAEVAGSGAPVRPAGVLWTTGSFGLAGFAGSWLLCRSILKRARSEIPVGRGIGALRAFVAFWVGLVVTTLLGAVAVVTFGQR